MGSKGLSPLAGFGAEPRLNSNEIMNQLIWLAFEESAVSVARMQQNQAVSQTLQAQIVIYTDSRYADKVTQRDGIVVINDNLVSKLNHPAVAALELEKLFFEYAVVALLAPHSQRWLRTLAILSAAAQMQFIPNLCTRFLPNCARSICAGRVVEKRRIPEDRFIGTLSLDEPATDHGLWPISAHPLTITEVADVFSANQRKDG